MRHCLATACLLVTGLASAARAADIREQLSSASATVGEQITLTVTVRDADRLGNPVIPRVESMDIELAGGPNQSSGMSIVNGRVQQWNEFTLQFGITPKTTGRLTVPAITIRADGKDYRTRPQTLVVTRGEAGPPLIVEVETDQREAYVEEPVRATLRVWIRTFRQDRVVLDQRNMWSLVDGRASDFGPFGEPAYVEQRVREDGRESAATYYVYEKDGVIWPDKPGSIKLGDVRVVMNYPMSLSYTIFGDLRLERSRRVSASPGPVNIRVKPIPEDDRPPDFNGAVGRYEISASAAPTDVSVGDPITLTLRIRGTGQLQGLGAPLLSRIETLTRDFKVPDEPLAGRVEGSAKIFTQTIRAAHAGVKRIPPIPFSFFDPRRGRFETAYSQPVPIRVKQASSLSLSQVVEAEPARPRANRPLVERSEGLLANYADIPSLLVSQQVEFGWPSAAVLAGCPAAYAALFLVRRRSDRYSTDSAYRRRSRAAAEARRRLHEAGRASGPAAAAQIHAAVTGYLADCLNLPHGALTREDVRRALSERGIDDSTAAETDGLLADVEMAEFAGLAAGPTADLVERARQALRHLEKAGIR
jgi:hypothetical protein